MRFTHFIHVCILLVVAAGSVPAQSSVDSTLHLVRSLYSSGAYSQAELEARRILDNVLVNDSIRVLAEQWVAFALVAQEKPTLAREHFVRILRHQPSYDLDPVFTSPKILSVFIEARTAFRAERSERADSLAIGRSSSPNGITFRTILFPGWEQWHQGRSTAGALFFGAGVAALGAGITFEFLRSAARRDYLSATIPSDIDSKYQTYNRYAKAEQYAFAVFALVYLASEIEVFTNDSPIRVSTGPAESSYQQNGVRITLSLR